MSIDNSKKVAFERDLIQSAIIKLHSVKVISRLELNYLATSDRLRDEYLHILTEDPQIGSLMRQDSQQALIVLAYHALGAGAFIAVKNAEGFEVNDPQNLITKQLLSEMVSTGSLQLGLSALYIAPESNNKKVIDAIVVDLIVGILLKYKTHLEDEQVYRDSLLNIFFNIGVTLAIQRISTANNQ